MIPADFIGAHLPRTTAGLSSAAKLIGCDPLDVQAVIDIETGGFGFLPDGRPKILFERHHFSSLTGHRFDATHPLISSPIAGGYIGGAGEYDRLGVAMALDRTFALQSTSWGLPQIMGSNFTLAGFSDAEAMVEAMCASEDLQLGAMANFIVKAGLADELQREDFTSFARRYNGPNYAANEYDKRLVADLSRLRAMAGASNDSAWPPLRQRVAKFQAALNVDGYGPLTVDGWTGQKTMKALRDYQHDSRLSVTGMADAQTAMSLFGQAV